MTVITTTDSNTATAYSNQRKVDRTSNGVLWAFDYTVIQSANQKLRFSYSTDEGLTWSAPQYTPNGSGSYVGNYISNGSFFIDQDDYAHVVFKDNYDNYVYYKRGTPNAGRTAWTWSAVTLVGQGWMNYPDIVAHREGAGWTVHISMSGNDGSSRVPIYSRLSVSSSGTITVVVAAGAGSSDYVTSAKSPAANLYPSIDFNHTGDGKTVAGGTPHLYYVWSDGATGAGRGIRFKKGIYSAGTWTWGTEREIDSTRYVTDSRWLNCLFDGTRIIIGGEITDTAGYNDIVIYDRDAADTTTTTRILSDGSVSNNVTFDYLHTGSLSYDSRGNVYMVGVDGSGSNGARVLYYRKWTRATNTLEPRVVVDSSAPDSPYISAKRGYSNNRIEYIYTDGANNPYSVAYGSITLNILPTAPSAVQITNPTPGGNQINLSWTHNDPDGDPQTAYKIKWRPMV